MGSPVVTGIGLVTSLGRDRASTWQSVVAARRAMAPLRLFELSGRAAPVVAEISEVPALPSGLPRRATLAASRTDRLGLAATFEALRDAGLEPRDVVDAAVVLGASSSGMLEGEDYYRLARGGHDRAPRRLVAPLEASSTTSRVATATGAKGPRATFTTACSSSAHAIGHALDLVRDERVGVAIAGGSDGLCRLVVAGFLSLDNVSASGCRPFAVDRDGMTLGEAAAFLVIEDEARARARGRRAYARLLGYGSSCEAYHATATDPTGGGAEAAIRAALRDAALDVGAIGYVNAHATGTRDNDAAEAAAITRVFPHRPAVSSTKALHGHSLGAAGALEAALTCLALAGGFVPGQGTTALDPATSIDVVERGRTARLGAALSLSLAFGGNDAALVLGAVS